MCKGCARVNGIAEATANAIFDFIARFAEYGFNKSHSAAYGWVSYQTAYLKAHYPVEFMAALLTHDASTTDRLAEIIAECSRMGLKILAPDVNSSSLHFTPEPLGQGMAIRFGLASIKNVGSGAMRSVIEEREKSGLFRSLEDFCARLDGRTVNRKILESLVKCGAFDCFGKSRAALFADLDRAMLHAAGLQRDRASGQGALFEELHGIQRARWLLWPPLNLGRETRCSPTNGSCSGSISPAIRWRLIQAISTVRKITTISAAQRIEESSTVRLAGIVCSVEKKFTKKDGKPFAVIVLEDFTGQMELTAWDEVFADKGSLLNPGAVISVVARLARRDDSVRAIINTLSPLKPKASLKPVRLRLARGKLTEGALPDILDAVRRFPARGR